MCCERFAKPPVSFKFQVPGSKFQVRGFKLGFGSVPRAVATGSSDNLEQTADVLIGYRRSGLRSFQVALMIRSLPLAVRTLT